ADKNIRRRDVGDPEQRVKLPAGVDGIAGRVGGVAPPIAGTIIGADARYARDLRLHPAPHEGREPQAGFQDNGWPALPHAMKMKFLRSNLDDPAVGPKPQCIGSGRGVLKNGANQREDDNQDQQREYGARAPSNRGAKQFATAHTASPVVHAQLLPRNEEGVWRHIFARRAEGCIVRLVAALSMECEGPGASPEPFALNARRVPPTRLSSRPSAPDQVRGRLRRESRDPSTPAVLGFANRDTWVPGL